MRKLFYKDKKKHEFMMLAHYTANYNTEEYQGLKQFEFPFSKRRYAELLNISEWDTNKTTGELIEDEHIEWIKKSKSRHESSIMKNLMAEKTYTEILTGKTTSNSTGISTSRRIENERSGEDLPPVKQPVEHSVTQPLSNKYISNKYNLNNYTSDSNEYRLAEYLYKHILKNNPKAKKPNFQTWSKHFDYILRIDKRELEEVKEVITFCENDNFWMSNILSPGKLREKYDALYMRMINSKKNKGGKVVEQSKKDYSCLIE